MQSELSIRLLGRVSLPRSPGFNPTLEALKLLQIDDERDSIQVFCKNTQAYFRDYDDLWFLQSALRIYNYANGIDKELFSSWYNELPFSLKRDLVLFTLEASLFQPLLDELLNECSFYGANLHLISHARLINIVLWKFARHKFNFRPRLSDKDSIIAQVCELIAKYKVRLNAVLAKIRVESGANSLKQLLSEENRSYLESQRIPFFYARLNKLKWEQTLKSLPEFRIEEILTKLGLKQVYSLDEVKKEQFWLNNFLFHKIGKDLIAFSSNLFPFISEHSLTAKGYLVMQDEATYNLISNASQAISLNSDVIVTNFRSGIECIHLSQLMQDDAHLHVFGVTDISTSRTKLALHNVKNCFLYKDAFTSHSTAYYNITNVESVLCLADNANLGLNAKLLPAIVDGGSYLIQLLQSRTGNNNYNNSNNMELLTTQRSMLHTALDSPSIQNVLYYTQTDLRFRSFGKELIQSVCEKHSEDCKKLKQQPFTFQSVIHGTSLPDPDGFLTVSCNADSCGYFIAALQRLPPPLSAPPNQIIKEAISAGILQMNDKDTHIATNKVKYKRKSKLFLNSTSHENVHLTFSVRQKFTEKFISKKLSQNHSMHSRPFR